MLFRSSGFAAITIKGIALYHAFLMMWAVIHSINSCLLYEILIHGEKRFFREITARNPALVRNDNRIVTISMYFFYTAFGVWENFQLICGTDIAFFFSKNAISIKENSGFCFLFQMDAPSLSNIISTICCKIKLWADSTMPYLLQGV